MVEKLAWNGCTAPELKIIEGQYVRLVPLSIAAHLSDLFVASKNGLAEERFLYLAELPPIDIEEFKCWMANAINNVNLQFFAMIDKRTNRAEGRFALMRMDLDNGIIEIGHILWGDAIKRSRIATEAFFLVADYVFALNFRRLEWKCNNNNEPSKKAALRFGFQYEGLFRQHMVVKGQNRDTAWFSIIDRDWSDLRQKYLKWLMAENFNENAEQKRPLNI